MLTSTINAIRVLSLVLLIGLCSCGGEKPLDQQVFNLKTTKADELIKEGMEKEIVGDTTTIPVTQTRVLSPDSTKYLWCEGIRVMIEDRDGQTQTIIHEETDDTNVVACFQPSWSLDGKEINFKEAIRQEGDSLIQVMNVIITLNRRVSE